MTEYNVKITSTGDLDPSTPLSCRPGDKITWTNNFSEDITEFTFTLPAGVSPHTSPAPIAVNATTGKVTVNNNASGQYTYDYGWSGKKRGTRTGTIDVGSR